MGGGPLVDHTVLVTGYLPGHCPRLHESDSGKLMADKRVGRSCWGRGRAVPITGVWSCLKAGGDSYRET